MTKSHGCEVILSEEVCKTASLPVDALPEQEVAIRGRAEPMIVRAVPKARILSPLVENAAVVTA
jgi:adenylate cyclase